MALTWLITGCSSGFGRNVDAKLSHLRDTGATILELDVGASPDTIKSKIDEAWAIHDGGIDVVVNNAGYILSGAVEELTQEDMEKSFQVNFHGPLNITRAMLPHLRRKGSGTLLYVSSQSAWHADPSASGYCSSKFALEGAVECLSKELAIFSPGLKVLIAEPGYCRTPVFDKLQHVDARVPEYAQFNQAVRQAEAALTANSPGDPSKAVARMIELVKGTGFADGRSVPLRVPLGSDSWSRVKAKCEETLDICRQWEDIAKSVDYI
ncbi:hypothetical protein F66182_4472 [Fusarium sp. NRRL 66182]|nr:hypothetical protein F66182_4472 [Fusarium sp. NRRL 66182]